MIYLDNSATTQPSDAVIHVYEDAMHQVYGNPASIHGIGHKADRLLSQARQVATRQFGVDPSEIVFTSGGTESNNMAIKGVALQYMERGKHIITTEVEHASVYLAFEQLQKRGFTMTVLPTDQKGRVSVAQLKDALRDDTILVSVMAVNNEIGTVQPIAEIAQLLTDYPKVFFHVDAVQAYAKVPLPDALAGIDLLSISGHKFHGPKGTGLLFVRKSVQLEPLLAGGGQESGLRSGTVNVPGIAAMVRAMQDSMKQLSAYRQAWQENKELLLESIQGLEGMHINGDTSFTGGAPHILSLSFAGLRGEVLVHALEEAGVYVSTRSACSSKKHLPSRVLAACGLSDDFAEGTIRISQGAYTTRKEMEQAAEAIVKSVQRLRHEVRR